MRGNYPIIRNLRYNLETIRPELRHYIVESDLDGRWEPLYIEWKENRFIEDDDSETDDGDETDYLSWIESNVSRSLRASTKSRSILFEAARKR